jgi:hypothetical protein
MENVNFINLTPHDVKIVSEGQEIVVKPCGAVARCTEVPMSSSESRTVLFNGVPVTLRKQVWSDVVGLPAPQDGVLYIVSGIVRDRVKRDDVVAPDTSLGAVRDAEKRIVGVLGLVY